MPAPHLRLSDSHSFRHPHSARRGVAWVLSWGFSLAVFATVTLILARFAVLLAAERALAQATEAGVAEATLPRATRATIQSVVDRHLAAAGLGTIASPVIVERNGAPVMHACRPLAGDRFSVAVAVRSPDVLPDWLARATSFLRPSLHTARVQRIIPDRH